MAFERRPLKAGLRTPLSCAARAATFFFVVRWRRIGSGMGFSPRQIGRGQFQDVFAHVLARLELDNGAFRNWHVGAGIVRIAANTRFSDFDLEDAKITQLDLFATCNSFSDVVKGCLNDIEDLLLHQPGLIADADDEVSFGH